MPTRPIIKKDLKAMLPAPDQTRIDIELLKLGLAEYFRLRAEQTEAQNPVAWMLLMTPPSPYRYSQEVS